MEYSTLKHRDEEMLKMFIEEHKTFSAISRHFGITRARVKQILDNTDEAKFNPVEWKQIVRVNVGYKNREREKTCPICGRIFKTQTANYCSMKCFGVKRHRDYFPVSA